MPPYIAILHVICPVASSPTGRQPWGLASTFPEPLGTASPAHARASPQREDLLAEADDDKPASRMEELEWHRVRYYTDQAPVGCEVDDPDFGGARTRIQ
jgi:hypothetical protein